MMLYIKDMSEKDNFYFLEGLKPWAQQELQRRGVADLPSTQAAAERLTNYLPLDNQKKKLNPNTSRSQKLVKGKGVVNEKRKDSETKGLGSGCFLCGGPHMVKNCPQKQALNVLQATVQKSLTTQDDHSSDDEEEQVEGPRIGALRLINVLKGQVGEQFKPLKK